jgi:uncharacterized protein (DUF433 family)
MQAQKLLERITCNPKVMAGKPVIRGTRLTVEHILNLRAHGVSEEEILAEYQRRAVEDIQACYLFASAARYGGFNWVEAKSEELVIRPAPSARQGWEAQFQAMALAGNDRLLDGKPLALT